MIALAIVSNLSEGKRKKKDTKNRKPKSIEYIEKYFDFWPSLQ